MRLLTNIKTRNGALCPTQSELERNFGHYQKRSMSLLGSFNERARELILLLLLLLLLLAEFNGDYQAAMDTRGLAEAIARTRVLNDRLDAIDQNMRQAGLGLAPWGHM